MEIDLNYNPQVEHRRMGGPLPTYYRYCVYYFYGEEGTTLQFLPYLRGIILRNPSECCMFIPGTYAQMLEDYE